MKLLRDDPVVDRVPWYILCDCGMKEYLENVYKCGLCGAKRPEDLVRKHAFLEAMFRT